MTFELCDVVKLCMGVVSNDLYKYVGPLRYHITNHRNSKQATTNFSWLALKRLANSHGVRCKF